MNLKNKRTYKLSTYTLKHLFTHFALKNLKT